MATIELRKPDPTRSCRAIAAARFRDVFVDGEFVGYFKAKAHGPHGVSYQLMRLDSFSAQKQPPRGVMRNYYELVPRGSYMRNLSKHPTMPGGHPMTQAERMIDCAAEAFNAGHIAGWKVLNAQQAERDRLHDEALAKANAARKGSMREKAHQVMLECGHRRQGSESEKAEYDYEVNAIVEAMEWAIEHHA